MKSKENNIAFCELVERVLELLSRPYFGVTR